ncbi:kinase [Thraustotheca clavata]|uniref:Kinase n=1 Tax=Thraustotheca clavata TaxID=74557 RepID=A0A1W0A3P2_9STRA|nr:kinase [Thraustotheca clavata]
MDTTIVCSVCNTINEILESTCSSCKEELPSAHQRLRILLLRYKHAKPMTAMNSDQFELQLKQKNDEIDALKRTIESLQQKPSSTNDTAVEIESERVHLAKERAEVEKMRSLVATLQTIPYIDPSQFHFNAVMETGQIYELQIGNFNGRSVVMKKILKTIVDEQVTNRFKASISLLAKLNGGEGTIVSLVGANNVGEMNPQIYLEHMQRGSLRTFLKSTARTQLAWKTRIDIALNMAKAVKYIHSLDLIHRDLSSHHVLINEQKIAKITGFTNAREIDHNKMTNGIGNFRYSSPESMVEGQLYTEKTDIYSLGLLMIELDTHEIPYSNCKDRRGKIMGDFMLLDALIHAKSGSEVTKHAFKDSPNWYRELAIRCTDLDPENRPSAVEIVTILQNELRQGSYDNIRSNRRLQNPPAVINLHVSVLRAKNLLDTQAFGIQDPFCKLSLGGQIARTKVHDKGGCDPRWDQVFTFKNIHPIDMVLEINILNKNWMIDGQIGKSTMPIEATLDALDEKMTWNAWNDVFSRGDKKGSIMIKFEFEGDLARWLEEYKAAMANFNENEGHLRSMHNDEERMKKISNILIPKMQNLGKMASGFVNKVAGKP